MKRLTAIAAILLGLVAVAFVFLRGSLPASVHRVQHTVAPEPEPAKTAARAPTKPKPHGSAKVRLSLDATKNPDDRKRPLPLAELARDRYYERLFATMPRDPKHERELLSKLAEAFSDKPDVSLGEVACNAEFCRAEIYGSVKEDLQKGNGSVEQDVAGDDGSVERDEQRKNGKTLMVAVEAKGLRFCMFDRDATHTKAGCYFGRDESWTAPSF